MTRIRTAITYWRSRAKTVARERNQAIPIRLRTCSRITSGSRTTGQANLPVAADPIITIVDSGDRSGLVAALREKGEDHLLLRLFFLDLHARTTRLTARSDRVNEPV